MRTSESGKNKRRAKKMTVYYECSVCQYISERYYNVSRHEIRIHTASAKQRLCCNLKFVTKGDYYLHCQECHPVSRPANLTSRIKYRIDAGLKKINPPKVSEPKKNRRLNKTVSQSRYMLRTRKNTELSKKYKDEEEEEEEEASESSSEASECESSADSSSSATSSQGSLSYDEKNQFLDGNWRNLDEPLNDGPETNDAAIDSGYYEDFTVSTNTDVGDEGSPIGSIDWCTNFEYDANLQVTKELAEQTLQIDAIDWCTNFETIGNMNLTNELVNQDCQVENINWCTNFEDVESENIENTENPQQTNDLAQQTLEILAIDWCPRVETIETVPAKNDVIGKDEKIVPALDSEKFENEPKKNEKNLKIDTIEWSSSLNNVKNVQKTKDDCVEAPTTETIEWCRNFEDFPKSPAKNCNCIDVSRSSYDLPIKKRILRLIPNIESDRSSNVAPSTVDRLRDRLERDNTVELKSRKKFRVARREKSTKKSRGPQNNKENVNPSQLSVEDKMKDDENGINYGTIEIHVDPRISFQNLTQDHREFFEHLLSNPSLSDRIDCTANKQLMI